MYISSRICTIHRQHAFFVCVLRACAVQCRTEMSPIVTTDWVPGLEGIVVASSLTLLLSRVFTHCRDFTAIKSTPCRVYSRLRAQAGRSINVFCMYYRALLTEAPPGPGATLANIGKYGSTSYIGKKMAANRKGIGPTTLKRAYNSTTNTRTKYLLIVMHKTLRSVWLTFVRRENETVQNCPIVLKNSSSSSSYYYYS